MFHITLTVSFLKWHHFTLIGLTNVLFGLLQWVEDSTSFLALSLTIRIGKQAIFFLLNDGQILTFLFFHFLVSAIGESAFFCAVFPLATKVTPYYNFLD